MTLARDYEEMVSAAWLSEALDVRHPGTVVASVEVLDVLHGVGTKAILELAYADGATTAPTRLCAKAGWESHNEHLRRGGVYAREARVYRDVLPSVDIRAPECHFSGVDEDAGQGIVLLEDLRASEVTFGTADRGFTVEEAAGFLRALAALHAHHWAAGDDLAWLAPAGTTATDAVYTDMLQANLDGSRADGIPAEVRSADRLIAAFAELRSQRHRTAGCVVHGDCHARNLFVDGSGEPGFFDFQTMRLDHWAIDVAYLLGANLHYDDRRNHVEDLLRQYLDHLGSFGVDAPTWDDAWLAYRRSLVYGLYLWGITRPQVQPLDVITVFVDRLGNAASEAESYAALGV